jgi:uncharacterized protein involved in response to NO
MTATAQQIRSYSGPALLSYGFRIFFLAGAVWAAFAMVLWLMLLTGTAALPSALSPLQWHVHELLFGFLPAVVAGFLLTAVPNWTGRLPVCGAPLLNLFLLWGAGRLAIFFSAAIGIWPAAAIDLAFLACLIAVMAREIVAGRNYKNLRVLVLVGVLLAGDAVFLGEVIAGGAGNYGTRLGIAAAVLLISLIGGRIIPSFTRNWLVRCAPGRLPVPFNRFDVGVILASAAALALWVGAPDATVTGVALLAAGIAHIVRLTRWAGDRAFAEPLLAVLHVGYAFVPIGFVLMALSILSPDMIAPSGALHAWTAGAIGTMTLAVMTRASLGHTGQALTAAWPTTVIYGLVVTAAAARLAAASGLAYMQMLDLSAAAWVLAFGGFAVVYGPMLANPRRSGA